MSHLTHTISLVRTRRLALAAFLAAVATVAVVLALSLGGGSETTRSAPAPTAFKGVDESRVAEAIGKGREPVFTLPNTDAPRPR
jgi:hypothetical protein